MDGVAAPLKIQQLECCILTDDGIVTNIKQVPSTKNWDTPPVEMHALPNARTEHPQNDISQVRALEKPPRDLPDNVHHEPDAEPINGPNARIAKAVAPDKQPLEHNRTEDH